MHSSHLPSVAAGLLLAMIVATNAQSLNATAANSTILRPINEVTFPSTCELREDTAFLGHLGLRAPASRKQEQLIDHVITKLARLDGVKLSYNNFSLPIWHTQEEMSLRQAGRLVLDQNGVKKELDLGGAIPYSLPTDGLTAPASMVYLSRNASMNTTDVRGKIVLRDFGPTTSLAYSLVFLPAWYRTPDTEEMLNNSYNRPYTFTPDQDLEDAASGGAVGLISMFDVPQRFIESYYDPHSGIRHKVPGLYVGKETAQILKTAAAGGDRASLSVAAHIGNETTREVTATLPGQTEDRLIVICHTDGNTWVQDNGVAATLALAKYFAHQSLSSRQKTLQFVFTSGHLAYKYDGSTLLAQQLDQNYDNGTTALVFPIEHMGTREILPAGSASGAANGQDLEFSGRGELMVWCVGPMERVVSAVQQAVQYRKLDRILVTRGASFPDFSKVPEYASFGGIGTSYHDYLVPTTAIISGPWSLWSPRFGASAIDFDRLRSQTLAVADVLASVDPLSREDIAGGYLDYRERRAAGAPSNFA